MSIVSRIYNNLFQKVKNLLREFRALKISLSLKFIIGVAVVLTITMSVSFYFISKKQETLIMGQVYLQAKALFKQIVLTRKWIADHGGVFVERLPGEKPNPYLTIIGKEAEIVDTKGRRFIRKNPALVTRELSDYAREAGLFWFHITSLKLINPKNAPDEFEKAALYAFEKGQMKESSKIEKIGSSYFYRYIAPLYIEKPCLKCHSHQGYKLGDVRGAISISVPMDYAFSMIRSGRRNMVLVSIVIISILMVVLFLMMKELVLRPVKQLKTSMGEFSKGKNNEISVIRTGDELEDLSRAFVEMSKSLKEYHTKLQDKIRIATKNLEEANAKLMELNKRKSDFIAKVSHELRTPLTSIKGAMDYLSSRFSMDSKSEKDMDNLMVFFDIIKKNADRLIKMVNDTLDLERIESGVFEMQFNCLNLLALVKEVIISFQSIASEKRVTFKIIAKNPEVSITADEEMIRQVLTNLISNALKVSPTDSEIHITVTESDDKVTVSVKDRGPGIPEEEHKRVFEKFYTRGTKNGTGLGLAICKGIIEAHHGQIGVMNNKGEKGCTFYFILPKQNKRGIYEK